MRDPGRSVCVSYWRKPPSSGAWSPDREWCICEDLDASSDRHPEAQWTACAYVVIMPIGLERRNPTCPECLALLAEAKEDYKHRRRPEGAAR
jgi:hypothetical protein